MKRISVSEIPRITDGEFHRYGKIISGVNCEKSSEYIFSLPQSLQGNEYVASMDVLESTSEYRRLQGEIFGGILVQAGYCNGILSTLNALEFHKSSEVILAVTDTVLILGDSADIKEGTYHTEQVACFFVPAGTLVELYPLTLHFAPCNILGGEGFRSMIVLPKGTNEVLTEKVDDPLLYRKNKWLLAHKSAAWLIAQGASASLLGYNIEIVSL